MENNKTIKFLEVYEFDALTNEETYRKHTEEEITIINKTIEEAQMIQEEQEAKIVLRQSGINKLSALGLTEDEISALLGIV
jgi:predicted XRE-type DNA-binding protein